MENPFLRKLENYVRLSDADRLRVCESFGPVRHIKPRSTIFLEGDHVRTQHIILDGWAYHYKQLENGRQQVVQILLPGDCCDLQVFRLNTISHNLAALSPVTLTHIPRQSLLDLTTRSPALDEAFHMAQLVNMATLKEWLLSLGRRMATERLAHLFCELHLRLAAIGLADGWSCPMLLTQEDLADALGQTSVHINRTLQELRSNELIVLRNRRLTILNGDALRKLASFDPTYLNLSVHEDGTKYPMSG